MVNHTEEDALTVIAKTSTFILTLLACAAAWPISAAELNWTVHPTNPVIASQNGFNGPFWNDPSVIRVGDQLVMYMSRNVEPISDKHHVVPVRATSKDGVKWAIDPMPLLQPSPGPKSFDGFRVETPSVVFHKGRYHMYYSGISRKGPDGPIAIGHAASPDGVNWRKDPTNPVLGPSGRAQDWNGYHVAEPGAVVLNNHIYLFFAAVAVDLSAKPPRATRTIGLAISADGTNFGPPQQVLKAHEVYPEEEGYEGYSTPEAVLFDGAIHLFYDVWQLTPNEKINRKQVALHHATSTDGMRWIEDPAPIFTRKDFPWTAREIRAPGVLATEDKIIMWFAGDDLLQSQTGGIGLAYTR